MTRIKVGRGVKPPDYIPGETGQNLARRLAELENSIRSSPGTIPVGGWTGWLASTPPLGWLICDGSAISRVEFAILFSVIGTTFGAGDGSTTFNIPDFRDRMPLGVNAKTVGQVGGGVAHAADGGHAHDAHGAAIPDHNTLTNTAVAGAATRVSTPGHSGSHASGGQHPHDAHSIANDTIPPYIATYFIVRVA